MVTKILTWNKGNMWLWTHLSIYLFIIYLFIFIYLSICNLYIYISYQVESILKQVDATSLAQSILHPPWSSHVMSNKNNNYLVFKLPCILFCVRTFVYLNTDFYMWRQKIYQLSIINYQITDKILRKIAIKNRVFKKLIKCKNPDQKL